MLNWVPNLNQVFKTKDWEKQKGSWQILQTQ